MRKKIEKKAFYTILIMNSDISATFKSDSSFGYGYSISSIKIALLSTARYQDSFYS